MLLQGLHLLITLWLIVSAYIIAIVNSTCELEFQLARFKVNLV